MEPITTASIEEAAEALKDLSPDFKPEFAIVLGSGLNGLAEMVEEPISVPFAQVPNMHAPLLSGHEGNFLMGTLKGKNVICMQGRIHCYEGYTAQQVAFPIFVMAAMGAEKLVITNAAGGIDPTFEVGDLMLITDHINFLGQNPCVGFNGNGGIARTFFDMGRAYDPAIAQVAREIAADQGITLKEGVYIATLGPSFETPAEIRAFRTLGADAVGMSTVNEVIAANSCGMKVLGLTLVSNPAAGVTDAVLSGDDVLKAAAEAASKMQGLVSRFVELA